MRYRRWLQFRLRTLLVGVLAIAASLAAWRWLVEPYRIQQATMAAIAEAGGTYEAEPAGPSWLWAVLGDRWCQNVTHVDLSEVEVDDHTLEQVVRLPALRRLSVSGPALTDRWLEQLSRLPVLDQLVVGRASVTRAAVDAFEQARPDVTVRIVVSFGELVPQNGEQCHRQVTWSAKVEWGPAAVPDHIRQWAGKVIRITGVPWSFGYEEVERAPEEAGAGPALSDVIGMGLRATPATGWNDLFPPPWETIAVRFHRPVTRAQIDSAALITLEGVLTISDPPAYGLQSARIVASK